MIANINFHSRVHFHLRWQLVNYVGSFYMCNMWWYSTSSLTYIIPLILYKYINVLFLLTSLSIIPYFEISRLMTWPFCIKLGKTSIWIVRSCPSTLTLRTAWWRIFYILLCECLHYSWFGHWRFHVFNPCINYRMNNEMLQY